jgi:hypothetical protein
LYYMKTPVRREPSTVEATNKCPYCGGAVSEPRTSWVMFDPRYSPFATQPFETPIQGHALSCLKCRRGYQSLDGRDYYCTDSYTRLVVHMKWIP